MKTLFPTKKITTPLVILSLVAGSGLISTQAYAGELHKRDKQGNEVHIYQNTNPSVSNKHFRKKQRSGDLTNEDIFGMAFGSDFLDTPSNRKLIEQYYNHPNSSGRRTYNPDTYSFQLPQVGNRYSYGNDVLTFEDSASLEPWSPSWREYCSQNYRTFDPRYGTYKGEDGLNHFCVAK